MASIRNDLHALCPVCGSEMNVGNIAERECAICHTKTMARETCTQGHFICDECRHKEAIKMFTSICMSSKSKDPVEIAESIMNDRTIRMHDQMHHTFIGMALLTAYCNSGGDVDLESAIREIKKRGAWFPGGVCGFSGTCGAVASAGAFYSIVTKTTPHSTDTYADTSALVGRCITEIGKIAGPRCCKRNSFIVMSVTIPFVEEKLGVQMDLPDDIVCAFSDRNDECIGRRCPFHPRNE